MKRNFLCLLAAVLILYSCQIATAPKNEVFTTGPEVDDAKKYFDAWVAGDWDGLRALYADTALSTHNTTEFTADSVISFHKARRLNYDKVEYRSDAVEFVKYEDGQGWTHAWGSIALTIKGTGKLVEVPIHAARQIAGGKIGREYLYYNSLPIAMALEEASAAATSTSK